MNPIRADFIFRLSEYFLEAQNHTDGQASARKPTKNQIENHSTLYYIPKTPITQAVDHFAKNLNEPTKTIKTPQIVIDLPFLNSLLDYSLGGSVAQIRTKETDALLKLSLGSPEKTDQEDDISSNWGAQNLTLILNEEQLNNLSSEIPKSLEQLKFKGAKRVVLQIAKSQISPEIFDLFQKTCVDLGLLGLPTTSETLDYKFFVSNLIDASLWGRYLETTQNLIEQIRSAIPTAEIYFIIDHKLQLISNLESFSPAKLCDHRYFEGFLLNTMTSSNFLYAGIESLKWLTENTEQSSALKLTALLHLDQMKEIEFIDHQLKMSPGPMCFGRGSKLMVLDFLVYQNNLTNQAFEIQGLDLKTNLQKVEQALQNLWRLSALRSESFEHFLESIQKNVNNHLHSEFVHFQSHQIVGPLSKLFMFSRTT